MMNLLFVLCLCSQMVYGAHGQDFDNKKNELWYAGATRLVPQDGKEPAPLRANFTFFGSTPSSVALTSCGDESALAQRNFMSDSDQSLHEQDERGQNERSSLFCRSVSGSEDGGSEQDQSDSDRPTFYLVQSDQDLVSIESVYVEEQYEPFVRANGLVQEVSSCPDFGEREF